MAYDPKIRRAPTGPLNAPARSATVPMPASNVKSTPPTPAASGHVKSSSFDSDQARSLAEFSAGVGDLSEGRKPLGGVADDSVGRKPQGGVADDSVGRKPQGGVADDSVGRKPQGGVADDSVGRKPQGGVADDSVGRVEVGRVEDADHIALREAIFERLETPRYLDVEELPPSRRADLASVGRELGPLVASSHSAALLAAAKKDPVVGARLEAILKATEGLPKETRAALLDTLATDGARTNGARVLEQITRSSSWKRLTSSQKVQLGEVMTATNEKGLLHLGALLETAPGKLLEQDSKGHTLLANLHQLATQPLNASLYRHTSTPELLGSVLRDVVNPNRIDQGDTTTCTVTSMQWELVNDDRAEYTRLIAGLASSAGKVTMMGGGVLRANPEDGLAGARHERNVSSALFQSAAIEYANGRDQFDPVSGQSTKYDGSRVYGGLNPDQQKRMLSQLFGIKYSTDNLMTEAEGAKALETLRGYDADQHVNRPVLMDLDQGNINHTVTLERIREGRVYFRDPYGELRSMPEASFAKVVVGLHRPMA